MFAGELGADAVGFDAKSDWLSYFEVAPTVRVPTYLEGALAAQQENGCAHRRSAYQGLFGRAPDCAPCSQWRTGEDVEMRMGLPFATRTMGIPERRYFYRPRFRFAKGDDASQFSIRAWGWYCYLGRGC